MSQAASARPYILRQTEGDTLWFLGSLVTLKATGADTRGRLTVAEFVNPAGFAPPLHRHLDEDEMFYLLSGSAEFRCDGQAFQAAGWAKGTFRVDLLHADADPMDIRYNIIQWVHRYTRGWSYGSAVVDPRTGEILKGNVTLGSLRSRQDYLIDEALLSPYLDGKPLPPASDPSLAMVLARTRQLAAHETGHTLGLADIPGSCNTGDIMSQLNASWGLSNMVSWDDCQVADTQSPSMDKDYPVDYSCEQPCYGYCYGGSCPAVNDGSPIVINLAAGEPSLNGPLEAVGFDLYDTSAKTEIWHGSATLTVGPEGAKDQVLRAAVLAMFRPFPERKGNAAASSGCGLIWAAALSC